MSSTTPTPPSPGIMGLAILLGPFVFWGLVATDHAGVVSLLDDEYKTLGFCSASRPSHQFNSYLLCFLVDTFACIILLSKGKRGCNTVGNAVSIFVHGAFHMAQFLVGWPLPPQVGLVVYPAFALGFVGGIGVGFRVGTKLHMIALAVAVEIFRMAFVPTAFDFAYAHAWIFGVTMAVSIYEGKNGGVAQPPPSKFILLAVVSPFGEALFCNRGYKAIGGHAIYDAAIAAGVVLAEFSGDSSSNTKKGE